MCLDGSDGQLSRNLRCVAERYVTSFCCHVILTLSIVLPFLFYVQAFVNVYDCGFVMNWRIFLGMVNGRYVQHWSLPILL